MEEASDAVLVVGDTGDMLFGNSAARALWPKEKPDLEQHYRRGLVFVAVPILLNHGGPERWVCWHGTPVEGGWLLMGKDCFEVEWMQAEADRIAAYAGLPLQAWLISIVRDCFRMIRRHADLDKFLFGKSAMFICLSLCFGFGVIT